MAVLVKLISAGDPVITYSLKADRLQHQFQRQPSVIPLPGDLDTGETSVISFDLGFCLEIISVSGVVDTVGYTEGSEVFPSKTNLENAVRTWWKESVSDLTALIKLQTNTGELYNGVIRGFSCDYVAAQTDRYPYSLQFQVISKVT